MSQKLLQDLPAALQEIADAGLYKTEHPITSPQGTHVSVTKPEQIAPLESDRNMLNFCANNYLGYADNDLLKSAAKQAIDEYGLGMASVRFICGTQTLHRRLERELADFLQTDDVILFASCFDANAGIFEVLLGKEDAIISDALNHASIIDGVRLCKAQRFRYANNDMAALEEQLQAAQDCRYRLIVTDGVFSMDGILANLPAVCDLAEKYDAMVMVDDSHAVGFVGEHGAGTPDHFGARDRVQILSGTFGKALGGAAGGYIAGPQAVVDMLRQRARPYLFSNALPPAIVAATLKALEMVRAGAAERDRLKHNAQFFRKTLEQAGFTLAGADHAIVPVMLGDAVLAQKFAAALLDKGIYVTAFSYPVVPTEQARIRVQLSAAHTDADLQQATDAFIAVGRELGVI